MPIRFIAASVLIAAALSVTAFAQPAPGECVLGRATTVLDVSNVQARLFNIGNLFWRGDPSLYHVPSDGGVGSVYTSALWIGGRVDGDLRFAGTQYSSYEYWPGPLTDDGSLPDPADCSSYDRIWNVSRSDIAAYYRTGISTPDMAEWPAQLGAPFYDHDADGKYNLEAGDQPLLRGDQVAWWVMNDVGNDHLRSRTLPLGVEVRVEAFAVASVKPALNDATFYRYTILYRGPAPLDSAYVGFYTDADIGYALDDYVGAAPGRHMAFTYNADDIDEGGYGSAPPAFGLDFLTGATYGGFPPGWGCHDVSDCDWDFGEGQYNALRGRYRQGQTWTIGGDGRDPSNPPTNWSYPSRPGRYWSEPCPKLADDGTCAEPLPPDDRRMVISDGPHTLRTGDTLRVDLAMLWARGACAWDCEGSSVDRLLAASDYVQNAYDLGDLTAARPVPVPPGFIAEPLPTPAAYGLGPAVPNPVTARATIRYDVPESAGPFRLTVYDVLGRAVARLVDGPVPAGRHEAVLDASALPSGVYVYRLAVPGRVSEGRRLTVVR